MHGAIMSSQPEIRCILWPTFCYCSMQVSIW